MKLQQIQEALSKIQEKDAISLTHPEHQIHNTNPQHTEIHPEWEKSRREFLEKFPIAKQMFAKGGEKRDWQIRFPVEMDGTVGVPDSKVTSFLRRNGGEVTNLNYRKGIVVVERRSGDLSRGIPITTKEVPFAIGKFLRSVKAPEEIIHAYENDPFRANQAGKYDLIITGHPIDIYGGSTGRGWTSCMNVDDKEFNNNQRFSPALAASHLKGDVTEHHHMAYLVKRGGDIDDDAIARTSFKMHQSLNNGAKNLLPEGKIYGKAPPDFMKIATEKMEELFPVENGIYVLSHNLYNDSTRIKTVETFFDKTSSKITNKMLDKIRDKFNDLNDLPYDSITAAQTELVFDVIGMIHNLNDHDRSILLHDLLSRTNAIDEACDVDNIRDGESFDEADECISNLNNISSIFGADDDDLPNEFNAALLSKMPSKILDEFFVNSPQYAKMFSAAISKMIYVGMDSTTISNSVGKFITTGNDKLDLDIKPHNFHKVIDLFSEFPNAISSNGIKAKFSNNTTNQVITGIFEEMVNCANEDGDNWDTIERLVTKFPQLVASVIDSHYKTLDLFKIVEEELGAADIHCDVEDMDTAKGWFEYAIMVAGGDDVKFQNDELEIDLDTEDAVKNVVAKIRQNCYEASTIDRVSELIKNSHFNLIEMFKNVKSLELVDNQPASKKRIDANTKFRNPVTGEVWSGRGLKPRWVVQALASGKQLEDFAI